MGTELMKGNKLVFVISLPRSGSTMLQHILGSHSEMAASAEPWIMFPNSLVLRKNGLNGIYNHRTARIAIKDYLEQLPNKEHEYFNAVRKMTDHLYNSFLEVKNKKIFIDKTSRYYLILPELFKIYPDAKFVFLVRNPLATFSSFITTMVNNKIERLGSVEYIKNDLLYGYKFLMNGYRLNKKNIHFIKYEDIILNQENEISKICEFIEVRYEPKMLNYGSSIGVLKGKLVDPKSIHKHKKPVSDYLDSWKENLKSKQQLLLAKGFIDHLGKELIEEMGYSFSNLIEYCKTGLGVENNSLKYYRWEDLMSEKKTRTKYQEVRLIITKNIQLKSYKLLIKYFLKRPRTLFFFLKNHILLSK